MHACMQTYISMLSHEAIADKRDGINAPLELHELVDAICQKVLLQFYNMVWLQGRLPPDWKKAIITPLLTPRHIVPSH